MNTFTAALRYGEYMRINYGHVRHQREMLPDGPGYWRMTCTCGFVSVPYTAPHEALSAPCPVEVHLRESAWRREQMEETSRAANAAHR